MADYNVKALALAVPADPSTQGTYAPAISVQNVGIHDADVTGQVTIYNADTGAQVFTSLVELYGLKPGETGNAVATDTWTISANGNFFAYGFVTTPGQNDPQLGQLPPSDFVISGSPPVPPEPVAAHAVQHEDGGSDEIDVDGLPGVLADAQTPTAHAATHQNGGDDQISIDGLSGTLASPQQPQIHGNTYHNPTMATLTELTSHEDATTAHPDATNLANRETTGNRVGLVPQAQLAAGEIEPEEWQDPEEFALRKDDFYGPTEPIIHGSRHAPGGVDPTPLPGVITACEYDKSIPSTGDPAILITAEVTAEKTGAGTVISFDLAGQAHVDLMPDQKLSLELQLDTGTTIEIVAQAQIDLPTEKDLTWTAHGIFGVGIGRLIRGALTVSIANTLDSSETRTVTGTWTGVVIAPTAAFDVLITGFILASGPETTAKMSDSIAAGLVRPTT